MHKKDSTHLLTSVPFCHLVPWISSDLGSKIQIPIRMVGTDLDFGSRTWIFERNRKVDSTVPPESSQIDQDMVLSRVFRRYDALSRSNRPNPHKMGDLEYQPAGPAWLPQDIPPFPILSTSNRKNEKKSKCFLLFRFDGLKIGKERVYRLSQAG